MKGATTRRRAPASVRGAVAENWALILGVCVIVALSPYLLISLTQEPAGAADSWPPGANITVSPLTQKYLAADAKYWGISPAQLAARNGCKQYMVTAGKLSRTVKGDAFEAAEAPMPGCSQRFSSRQWATMKAQPHNLMTLRLGCVISVHEYGHSLGRRHSNDPRNVMYPVIGASDVIPACNAAFPTPILWGNCSWAVPRTPTGQLSGPVIRCAKTRPARKSRR